MSVDFAYDSAPGGGNSSQTVVFIALSYGMGLLIAAWVLYRVSGGLFNPAASKSLRLIVETNTLTIYNLGYTCTLGYTGD